MFTEADLAALVPPRIFDRGAAYYYEDDAVGPIQRKGNMFKARVAGTDTYRVSLEVGTGGSLYVTCDCPYEHGDVCKHGIALGLAVLDWLGENLVASVPTPPAKQRKKDRAAQLVTAAWARTSEKEKLDFLRQLLLQKPKQLRRFLKAFEFDEKALAALPAPVPYPAKPRPQPPRRPAPRRVLTLTEQAQLLLEQQRGPELLPLLLAMNWLQEPPPHDSHTLPYLLKEAARFQPEATLDAVMERFEGFLEDKALRAYPLYNRLAGSLKALAAVPALTKQVQLFASELLQQHRRLRTLHDVLSRAGFAVIASEEATDLPLKPRKRPLETAETASAPKRRGRLPNKSV